MDDEPKSVEDYLYEPIVVVAPPAKPAPEDDYMDCTSAPWPPASGCTTSLTSSQASQSLLNSTLQGMWNQQALGQFQQSLNDWQAQKIVEGMLNDRGMIE